MVARPVIDGVNVNACELELALNVRVVCDNVPDRLDDIVTTSVTFSVGVSVNDAAVPTKTLIGPLNMKGGGVARSEAPTVVQVPD